jgi:hypothetical protein
MKGTFHRMLAVLAASITVGGELQASTASSTNVFRIASSASQVVTRLALPMSYAELQLTPAPRALMVSVGRRADCQSLVATMGEINASTGRMLGSLGEVQAMMQLPMTVEEQETLQALEWQLHTAIDNNWQAFDDLFDTWWASCG